MERQDIINKLEILLETRNAAQTELCNKEDAFQRFAFQMDKITGRNKFVRVLSKVFFQEDDGSETEGQTSARFFVDLSNGDIYKTASFKAPAKGVRGNIFKERDERRFENVNDGLYFYAG